MSIQELMDVYSSALDFLVDTFYFYMAITIKHLPSFALPLALIVSVKLFEHFTNPKYNGPVFDDSYAKDFDLAYDSLRRYYDSDNDFINDYMSDFTAFQDDEPELDELVEFDMWDNVSFDRYYDNETHFVEESEAEFSIGFEDFEGSYSDFVESEED